MTALDRALPWGGLARGGLHEIEGGAADGAVLGFATALVVRLLRESPAHQAVLWCVRARALSEVGAPYGPGLAAFGLDPERLILVRVKRAMDVLWAMREGLASRRLAAVVGEGAGADLNDSRRLQLAAEASGVTALLLRTGTRMPRTSAALTRWAVETVPSGVLPGAPAQARTAWSAAVSDTQEAATAARRLSGAPAQARTAWSTAVSDTKARWRVRLVRCRGGVPGEWTLEWCHEAGDLALAASLPDRSVEPAAAGVAL